MKVTCPEISWHGREPVYSVDFQYLKNTIQRIASCGADRHVRIWEVKIDSDGTANAEFLSSLTRHTKTVNCVRFSPDGQILASGGDDSVIMLWKLSDSTPAANIFQDEEEDNKETWNVFKVLRSHLEDVYDLSWSSDGNYLLSGSVDNSAIMWDVKKGCRLTIMPEHKSFVQGVAFDPLNQYLATMSSDRCCRIFSITRKNCVHTISRMAPPLDGTSAVAEGTKTRLTRIFHDDTMKSFYRRLSFSPDGSLLVAPAGCMEDGDNTKNTTWVFTRHSLPNPVMHLPGSSKATIAVRFSPILYDLRKVPRKNGSCVISEDSKMAEWEKYETMFCLPYRMVFAIITEDSILFYDTQQPMPFAMVSNTHYHQLSDISWSHDGNVVIVSSTDGYCTIISFKDREIGTPYKDQAIKTFTREEVETMEQQRRKHKHKKRERTEKVTTSVNSAGSDVSPHSASPASHSTSPVASQEKVEQGTSKPKTPRRITVTTLETEAKTETSEQVTLSTKISEAEKMTSSTKSSVPTPRRVQVTTLSVRTPSTSANAELASPRRIAVTTLQAYSPGKQEAGTPPATPHRAKRPASPVTSSNRPAPRTPTCLRTPSNTTQNTSPAPRRVQVTTLSKYETPEKSSSFKEPQLSTSTCNLKNATYEDQTMESDDDLHLVLDTDTAMADDVDMGGSTSSKPSAPSPASKTVKPRRVQVTTLQTFDS